MTHYKKEDVLCLLARILTTTKGSTGSSMKHIFCKTSRAMALTSFTEL
eukprot:CAMPEP_0116992734 /NCGR_PEP_ID=MMETSP0467-20121206/66991_1 /TAXON_ID=283647 /ORGANISM="Mesodinium pulex, Strain SPMC105" /LENGTH=47 /DNA_ID= /DNA_START= /DNA_END= /DNA_ORIENTATION=